jgi:hypothetical protein
MSEPAKKPNQQPAPESYSPKDAPEIITMLQQAQNQKEKCVDTFTFGMAVFEVMERPEALWVGTLAWAADNSSTPDGDALLKRYQSLVYPYPLRERINPDWSASLHVNYRQDRTSPKGLMNAQETFSAQQDDCYNLFTQPAGLWIRYAKNDEQVRKLLGKKSYEMTELFALMEDAAARHGYRPVEENPIGIYYHDHANGTGEYAYIQVEKTTPESYQPKDKPEMMRALGEQAIPTKLNKAHMVKTEGGGARVDFDYVFCGFRDLDFTNCFASLYMYLEGFAGDADVLKQQQERLFFLFDTVSGRSAALRGWGNEPTDIYQKIYDTDDMVDFLMGYTGYAFEKHTDNLAGQVRASLDSGFPVLARMKKDGAPYLDGKGDSFRVMIGYDGGKLRMAEPKGAQNPPKKAPKLGEIENVYVITGRVARRYTLLDGLRRILRVMDCDREAGVWDECIGAFSNSWEKLDGWSLGDIKQLFKTAHDCTTWNCHNFGAPFRTHEYLEPEPEHYQNWIWEELYDTRIRTIPTRAGCAEDDPLRLPPKTLIDWASDQSHNRQWQLHALYETRDWKKKYYRQMEWANCETALLLLQKLKEYDGYIYQAVCAMIEILEEESK